MKTVQVLAIAAIAFLSASPSHAANPLTRYDDHSTAGLTRVSGPTYVNNDYGYSVQIPAGQTAWMDTPPSPNHGVNIYLGPHRSIEIDASFDSALLGSTSAVANEVAGYVAGAQSVHSADKLDGKPAERVVQTWPASDRRRVVVARWVGEDGPGNAINFVITLETTAADYRRDQAKFDEVVKSFKVGVRKP